MIEHQKLRTCYEKGQPKPPDTRYAWRWPDCTPFSPLLLEIMKSDPLKWPKWRWSGCYPLVFLVRLFRWTTPEKKNHNFSHSDKFLSLKSTVGAKMLVKSRILTLPPFVICKTILTYRPRSFCLIRSQLVSAGPSFLSTSLVCFFAFQGWRRRCWWKRRHSVEAW